MIRNQYTVKIIDTHAHIFQPDFDTDIDEVIHRAKLAGIEKILLPNIDTTTIGRLHNLCCRYPGYCLPMMGLHPTSVTENWREGLNKLKEEFGKRKYIAIGEIGIDLYWDTSLVTEQKFAFEEQLRWSIVYNLPVAIHSRNAVMECVESIRNVGIDKLRGVFHSFGGNPEELGEILSLRNFYIGINGVITFKNSGLSEVLKSCSISHIIIETDSPYLAPVPYRGKRNEPSYTVRIMEKLSEIFNIPMEDAAGITTENAKKLFGL